MDKIERLEWDIKRKKEQVKLLKKEIEKLETFKRHFYFSMMNGRGAY